MNAARLDPAKTPEGDEPDPVETLESQPLGGPRTNPFTIPHDEPDTGR